MKLVTWAEAEALHPGIGASWDIFIEELSIPVVEIILELTPQGASAYTCQDRPDYWNRYTKWRYDSVMWTRWRAITLMEWHTIVGQWVLGSDRTVTWL